MDHIMRFNLMLQAMGSKISFNISPKIIHLHQGDFVKNAPYTSDEEPFVGNSWKDYWQIFTRQDFPKACPLCGLPLQEHEISGCHVFVLDSGQKLCSNKKYIIPGHQGCNSKHEHIFKLKIDVDVVEAISKEQVTTQHK